MEVLCSFQEGEHPVAAGHYSTQQIDVVLQIYLSIRQCFDKRFHPADSSLEIQFLYFPILTVHQTLQIGLEILPPFGTALQSL